jgi:hypothetical protein
MRAHALPYSRLTQVAAIICLSLLSISYAGAQSALFNIPTADVLGEGEKYVEADLDVKIARLRNGGWQSYGFAGIYGVAKNAEVGVNAYLVRTADGYEALELQPNFKYRFYKNEERGITAAVGAIGYLPASRRAASDASVSVYVMASKEFKKSWTPRFSAGAYQLVGTSAEDGDKRGFMVGVEQPVHSRVSLIADWNSGKNRFGYSAAGVGITLTKNSYLYSAYYFGNEGRGNNSLGVYYGFSF